MNDKFGAKEVMDVVLYDMATNKPTILIPNPLARMLTKSESVIADSSSSKDFALRRFNRSSFLRCNTRRAASFSGLSSSSSTPCNPLRLQEVMGYDLYQFNDQFNRLKIMDDYEVSVQALLHGAKKEL